MVTQANSLIFYAFSGRNQPEEPNPVKMAENFELWHLKGMTLEQFIMAIQARIPPVNGNVLNNYKTTTENERRNSYSISEDYFSKATWGILLPAKDSHSASGSEFVLNLFAKQFLYPLFVVNDMGIQPSNPHKNHLSMMYDQTQQDSFKNSNFPLFYRTLQHTQGYSTLEISELKAWDKEDWRFATAANLFQGLKTYDDGKNLIGWQRESADIATTLECLLTAEDDTGNEVGYRLRKRAAILISHRFPEIENDLKKLYKQRSSFVHGSFFASLAKQSSERESDFSLPFPDTSEFEFLRLQTKQLRFIFVACLLLAKAIREGNISDKSKRVLDILEDSIINVKMREKIRVLTDPILDKLPN